MKTIEDLTITEVLDWQSRKNKLKTIGEFKELGRELRDKFNLTDRQAIDILNGKMPELSNEDIKRKDDAYDKYVTRFPFSRDEE